MKLFGQDIRLAKRFRDGTHRACNPSETFERLQAVMPQLGITRVANVTGLDTVGLPVWVAVRPNACGLATSQGKGLTHAAAKASALMESVETWHGENLRHAVQIASYHRLAKQADVIDINRLSRYADRPVRPDLPISWVEGYDLMADTWCWVPYECVSTNYVVSADLTSPTSFVQSSNGLAGGNHILEAICHALAELIERDAVTLAAGDVRAFNPARIVRLDSVTDANCRHVLELLEQAGVRTAIFDITSDLGIACYACAIVDGQERVSWRTLPVFNGYGCHLSPDIALLRAITEAAQSRLTYISGSRDDISQSEYARGGNWDDLKSVHALLDNIVPERCFGERPDQGTDCFEGDISVMISALQEAGVNRVVAVDLRQDEIGIPVVKLIAPGLAAPVPLIRGRTMISPEPRQLRQEIAA
jgi:ribosomal protein S12 methylthiotransferase accessory factor